MEARQANNFDAARFLAAALVMLSHSFPLSGSGTPEPLAVLSGGLIDLGRVAVIVFFIMSGFLIAGSWGRRAEFQDFLWARVLRILPGLAVALLVCIVAGAVLTRDPSSYARSALTYFVRNLLLYKGQAELEGVFDDTPYGPVVNGSLWTLRLEFTCYLLVLALGVASLLSKASVWLVWLLASVLTLWPTPSHFLRELGPLLLWFAAGAIAYFQRTVGWRCIDTVGALLALLLFVGTGWRGVFLAPLLAMALIAVLYLPGQLNHFGQYGDFSYGMYIYAFPAQQLIAHLGGVMPWWVHFLLAFAMTLLLAVLSWNMVEARCLQLKAYNPLRLLWRWRRL